MPKFKVDSTGVWIKDSYHPNYPDYVKILQVLPDGYRVQVILFNGKPGPEIDIKEDQLSDELI